MSGKSTVSAAAAVAWPVGSGVGITIWDGAVEVCGVVEGDVGPDAGPVR